MSYRVSYPSAFAGRIVGDGECVAFVKQAAHAPPSSTWSRGEPVLGNHQITPGTVIACGWDAHGTYPNHRHGNHAAIYDGQDGDTIWVWDQWHGHVVERRAKKHNPSKPYHIVE
jgi:hypothetical protein